MTSAQQQEPRRRTESEIAPEPVADRVQHRDGKLQSKVALIVGGESGLSRAVAIAFAKEGADVAIVYRDRHENAEHTKQAIEKEGRSCLAIAGNVGDEGFCQQAVQQTIDKFGRLDILVNNAAEQQPPESVEDITAEQLERTLHNNICAMYYMTNAALPYLNEGSTIINSTSFTENPGNAQSLDYSSSRGAIMTFTRTLSESVEDKGIRVNGVAPGPMWTLLVRSTSSPDAAKEFDQQMPTKPVKQPEEIASSFVFLASDDASYMAGQVVFAQNGCQPKD